MTNEKRKLGIIAGGGSIPKKLIEKCIAEKIDFVVVAIEGNAEKNCWKNAKSPINGFALVRPEADLNFLRTKKSKMLL